MITASIVTYNHHLLDIEPVLRSLLASPVDVVFIIDHSESMLQLEQELNEYTSRVFTGEPSVKARVDAGFQLRYIRHKNNGYGGGNNVAMREAKAMGSEYHLVVNPDVWFGPRVIPALKDYMEKHKDVGQMMPKVLYPDGSVQRLAKMLPTPFDLFGRLCLPQRLIDKRNEWYELQHSGYEMTINAPCLSGCFMFFRMSAIDEVGMFDERFFMYGEDFDLSRRMHARYKTMLYHEVPIYHKFSRASRHEMRLFIVHIISMIKYFNKWGWWTDPERDEMNRKADEEIVAFGEVESGK